jgi:hypothetical protein
MNESALKKIAAWAPLLIAAGYFVFLIATYVKVVSQLKLQAVAVKADDVGLGSSNEG